MDGLGPLGACAVKLKEVALCEMTVRADSKRILAIQPVNSMSGRKPSVWCHSLLVLCLLLVAGICQAKTIYVSKAGSNTSPYDTWAKAATTVATALGTDAAGDTVIFGAGVYLNSQISPPTGSTRPDMTYYLDSAYVANGSNNFSGAAIISSGDSIPKSAWAVYSGNVYRASWTGSGCDNEDGAGGQAYVGTQDDVLLEPQLSVGDVNASGEFYHDLGNNYVYVQCFGNVNPNTVEIQVACKSPVKFSNTAQDNIFFGGLDIRMGKRGAVLFLEGADSCLFRHCKLSRTSYCQTCNPAVVMGNKHEGGTEVRDSSGNWDNTYSRFNVFTACSLGLAIAPEGEGVYAHKGSGFIGYDMTETTFDSCVFYSLPGDGIEVKNSYATGTNRILERVTARYSKFIDIGGEGVNLYTNAVGCSVYGSIFVNCGGNGVLIGNSNPASPDYGAHAIYNNTFYQCNNGFSVLPSGGTSTFADHSGYFKYNIIYDRVASSDIEQSAYGRHYDMRSQYNANMEVDIDSNQIYEPSGSFAAMYDYPTVIDWSTWQGLGYDVQGLNTDPGLNTSTFETTSAGTMNRTYGGRTWTLWGAVQPADDPPAPEYKRLRSRVR